MDPLQRQQLREQFLQRASQAFDQLFDNSEQDALVTFTQCEDRACLLGQDMIAWLLQHHVNTDPTAQPDAQLLSRSVGRECPDQPLRPLAADQ